MTGWVVVRRDKWTFHGVVHLQGTVHTNSRGSMMKPTKDVSY